MTASRPFDRPRLWLALLGLGLCLGCSDSRSADVEVIVRQVTIDPSSHSPVVLLENRAHTVALPIWIGPAEAQAIAMRLQGVAAPRPMTHDLMKNVLERLGVDLRKVVISELRKDTYHARLFLESENREIEVDSRPSDAIALALRFERPIFVAPALLQPDHVIALRETDVQTLTMGGVTVQLLSPELAEHFHLPPGGGVLVSDVADRRAPLHRGDVILAVEGHPVRDVNDFRREMRALARRADLSVQREGDRIHVAFGPLSDD
jgi:bifunctional DNase/RNase